MLQCDLGLKFDVITGECLAKVCFSVPFEEYFRLNDFPKVSNFFFLIFQYVLMYFSGIQQVFRKYILIDVAINRSPICMYLQRKQLLYGDEHTTLIILMIVGLTYIRKWWVYCASNRPFTDM